MRIFHVASQLCALAIVSSLPVELAVAQGRGDAACLSLAALELPQARVTAAELVAAGAYAGPAARDGVNRYANLPAFCRVAATLTPTAESDIKIEAWLPVAGWNNKLVAVGNGGWNGAIDRPALADGLRRGYAAVGTDTGHEGGGGPWMRNREKLIDYGHRAVHEMTLQARAIATAFYAAGPKLTYFDGCSAGGRQGLKAAQRYPDDFDGIVAGAPALNATGRATFAIYVAQNLRKEPGSYIPPAKYPAIHSAVVHACDALDGVADGVLENPRMCKFDPDALTCTSGESDSCLTPPQVEAARKMYEPVKHARTGGVIFPGLARGSELGWTTFGGAQPFGAATQMFQFMVFDDPKWDFMTLNFERDIDRVAALEQGLVDAQDPNLKPFAESGGKLIVYHGWSDPQIPAESSVRYYESVVDALGARKVKDSARLFMVPGMNHCGGGEGTASFDMLAALERWVEQDRAPDSIAAARVVEGKTVRTRPLCPYPQVATYRGSGSMDDAASFVCR
jgi:feruloyl esterase